MATRPPHYLCSTPERPSASNIIGTCTCRYTKSTDIEQYRDVNDTPTENGVPSSRRIPLGVDSSAAWLRGIKHRAQLIKKGWKEFSSLAYVCSALRPLATVVISTFPTVLVHFNFVFTTPSWD
eukprot:GHVU01108908.1.p4 GENE.GHVU01108908.1~~GHVU01108908.1.p4  ORF type:complete len:123 (+),score=7.81 GHVU01108908.1:1139-1507(+)